MEYCLTHKRELTPEERAFVSALIAKEKPTWHNQVSSLKVIGRCGCGNCPTVMFGSSFDSPIEEGGMIADYVAESSEKHLVGVSLLGTEDRITELEFWSVDGENDVTELPLLNTLRPFKTA